MPLCSFSIRGGLKHWILIILIIHIIVSYDQNISLIIYVKDGSHVRLRHSSCVYITAHWQYNCSTKDAYTSEITFLALNPWIQPYLFSSMYQPRYHSLCILKYVIIDTQSYRTLYSTEYISDCNETVVYIQLNKFWVY